MGRAKESHPLAKTISGGGVQRAEVYKLAELIRAQRGGTAIVMGALSPRTRNAQVELFQSGDVDYMVATDAIGVAE